jgi:hypothetical protein
LLRVLAAFQSARGYFPKGVLDNETVIFQQDDLLAIEDRKDHDRTGVDDHIAANLPPIGGGEQVGCNLDFAACVDDLPLGS